METTSPVVWTQSRRTLATGTRGSRGHGWFVNYRAGKGGRHLQGEYYDRDLEACQQWNDAILALGSTTAYLDVVLEPRSSGLVEQPQKNANWELPPLDTLTGKKVRLTMQIADQVMPETCQNFVDLCEGKDNGYTGTLLYRIEKGVGICGGDVLTNTGKTGKAAAGSPLTQTIQDDPLALWHLPGTVTFHVPKVDDIDSRFILCSAAAPHLDGINRAFGQLDAESLEIVQDWEANMLTSKGAPSSFDVIIVGSGTIGEPQEESA